MNARGPEQGKRRSVERLLHRTGNIYPEIIDRDVFGIGGRSGHDHSGGDGDSRKWRNLHFWLEPPARFIGPRTPILLREEQRFAR